MWRRRPKKRPPTPSEWEDDADREEEDEEAPMLPVGAEVEVRSDDPGFHGSFYEATVAGHLISRGGLRRYTLAYSALLAEEGGPLKDTESAAAADVRPRPPLEENARAARRGFAICDMVEAFHNEGWWAGVVSAVPPPLAGDRRRRVYKVTFPRSRDIMEFKETALRPHRVFQDGRWVPAAEVDNGSTLFSEGNQVEVSQSGKNISESWSPASVLKVIGAYFLVQYKHIGNHGELAIEIVDSQYIRPALVITRMLSRYRFSPSSHVEVFHQGNWWPGVIVEVLGSAIIKKYVVKLKNHVIDMEDVDCVLAVENTELRPRYDWDGKKWVRYLKEKPAKRTRLTAKKRPIDEGDEFRPGSCCDKKLKKAYVASESISPLFPVRNEKYEFNNMSWSYPEETMEQRNAVLALGSLLATSSLPPVAELGQLGSSPLSPGCHLEQSSQMSIIPYMPQGRPLFGALGQTRPLDSEFRSIEGSKIISTDKEKQTTVGSRIDLSRQKEEFVAFRTSDALGVSSGTIQPEKGIAAETIEEDNNIIAIFEDLAQLPDDMITGSEILPEMNRVSCIDLTPCKDISDSQERSGINDLLQGGSDCEASVEQDTGEDLCRRYLTMAADANFHLPSAKSCEANVHDDQLCMDNTSPMVERTTGYVAPTKDLSIISLATLGGAVPNLLQSDAKFEVDITDDMDEENHQGNLVGSPSNGPETQYARVHRPFSSTSLAAIRDDIVVAEYLTKELSDSSQSIDKSAVTWMCSVGVGNYTESEPGNSLAVIKYVDRTPMSKYVASRTHDSCCPLSPESVDIQESIIDMDGRRSECLAIQHLPFVKTIPFWADLEALEIFSKVPQRPNYHQLQKYCPELREGVAFGLMLSFANLAASITRLEVQDNNGPLEQRMLALSLLEANGFDVRDMRARLETLLHARNSCVELQDAMKKLGQNIAQKETEDRELGEQIRKLAMAVHHLELHAYLTRDIMRSAISQKMNNAMEISRLKTEANGLERLVGACQHACVGTY